MAELSVTQDLWPAVKDQLRKLYPRDVFEAWFAPLESQVEGDEFVLYAQNEFAAIWIEDNYLEVIREKLLAVSEHGWDIRLETRQATGGRVEEAEPGNNTNAARTPTTPRQPARTSTSAKSF